MSAFSMNANFLKIPQRCGSSTICRTPPIFGTISKGLGDIVEGRGGTWYDILAKVCCEEVPLRIWARSIFCVSLNCPLYLIMAPNYKKLYKGLGGIVAGRRGT